MPEEGSFFPNRADGTWIASGQLADRVLLGIVEVVRLAADR